MKKGLLVGGLCLILLICAVVVGVGGYFGWKYLQDSPETAWTEAFDSFSDGDYFKIEVDSSMTMKMSFPDFPGEDQTLSMRTTQEGEADVQGDKEHSKATVTIDGNSTKTETYKIGNDLYTSSDGGEFVKTSATDENSMDLDATLEEIANSNDYTVLDDEKVDGEDAYHYQVDITKDQLETFLEGLKKSMAENSDTVSDISVTGGKMEVWVTKADKKLAKIKMTLSDMTFTATTQGYDMNVVLSDFSSEQVFSDWGVENKIEAPI